MNGGDPQAVRVFDVLQNMRIKMILAITAVIILLISFGFFCYYVWEQRFYQAGFMGGFETIFAVIVFQVYKHYFFTPKSSN